MATQTPGREQTGSGQNIVGEWSQTAQQRLQQSYRSAADCVAEYPTSAVLTSFAIGFGVGIVLGCALGESAQPKSRWYDLRTAERLGRNVLDSIVGSLPDSIASRLPS